MAALLVRDAARFDVVVTTNMYGDILSDEAAELSGSLGLAASINAGDVHCMAQAQHGSAPDIAGQDRANPASLVLSAAMLLGWLARKHGRDEFATAQRLIDAAVDELIAGCLPRARPISAGRSAPGRSPRRCAIASRRPAVGVDCEPRSGRGIL